MVLHAVASDPDGDAVRLAWMRYADADTCEGDVPLEADGAVCAVSVPAGARPGDTIHVICRATDEGNGRDEYMVSYSRVVVTLR